MKFGVQADQETKLAGSGGSDFVRYLKTNGEYRLRFLEEYPEGFTSYWEHFSNEFKCGYPCTREKDCPGCNVESEKEARPTRRLLVNAYLVSAPEKDNKGVGYSGLWKFPAASVEPTIKRAKDSKGTVLDRDFTVIRYEDNNRVNYDVEREDPEEFDSSKHPPAADHEEVLQESFEYRWDPAHREEKKAEQEKRKADRDSKAKTEEVEQDHAAEPEPETPYELLSKEERAAKDKAEKPAAKPRGKKLALVPDEPEEDEEDNIQLTPNQVRKMSVSELKKFYRKAGLDLIDSEDQKELADHFLEEMMGSPVS